MKFFKILLIFILITSNFNFQIQSISFQEPEKIYDLILDTTKFNKNLAELYIELIDSNMNYTQTKDLCVSRFIDFSNENASPYFCLESDFCPRNRLKYFNIFYFL